MDWSWRAPRADTHELISEECGRGWASRKHRRVPDPERAGGDCMLRGPALCWVPPGCQKGSGPFGVLILTPGSAHLPSC